MTRRRARAADDLVATAGRRGHHLLVAGVYSSGVTRIHAWARPGLALPDERTLFEIGSITKGFTGILLADMVERGEARLEEPLSALLPAPSPRWPVREPTLLELATHRSGLPSAPRRLTLQELAFVLGLRRRDPWAAVAAEAFDRVVARVEPRRPPAVKVRYSNLGFGLLGRALANRAGFDYDTLVRERVCLPLGMKATAVKPSPEHASLLTSGHSRRGKPRPPLTDWIPAAGSLRSSAGEMLRLLAACVRPDASPLSAAIELATRPHARIGGRASIGLGWLIVRRRSRPPLCWHNGGTWGFRSFTGFVRDSEVAVVVLANTFRSVDRLGLRLLDALEVRGSTSSPEDVPDATASGAP